MSLPCSMQMGTSTLANIMPPKAVISALVYTQILRKTLKQTSSWQTSYRAIWNSGQNKLTQLRDLRTFSHSDSELQSNHQNVILPDIPMEQSTDGWIALVSRKAWAKERRESREEGVGGLMNHSLFHRNGICRWWNYWRQLWSERNWTGRELSGSCAAVVARKLTLARSGIDMKGLSFMLALRGLWLSGPQDAYRWRFITASTLYLTINDVSTSISHRLLSLLPYHQVFGMPNGKQCKSNIPNGRNSSCCWICME